MARIALIPAFMWAMTSSVPYARVLALMFFIVASATDAVDGYIARRFNQVTNFGKFIDPLADKLLVTAALLLFVQLGQMSAVAAMLVISREFLVTSLRMVAVAEGQVIAASWEGKAKTMVQILCIAFLLTQVGSATVSARTTLTLDQIAVWLMVVVTIWSGVMYIIKHKDVIRQAK